MKAFNDPTFTLELNPNYVIYNLSLLNKLLQVIEM